MLQRFTCVHTLSQGFRILLLPVSCCTTCTTLLLLLLCKTSHWHWYWYTWTIRTRWYSVCGTKERRRNTQIKLCEWPDISMSTTTKTQQSSTQLHVTPQCNHDPPPIPLPNFWKRSIQCTVQQHWKPIFWVQTGDFNNSCVVLHACVTQCIFKCRNIRCIPFFLFQHICQWWAWRHATQPNTVVQWIRTWTAWYHAINACGVRGWSGVCVTKAVGDGDVNVLICNQCLFLTQWQYFSIHIVFGKFNG